ncbi:MAG: Structural maintenance of chromosomes protein 5 [Chaenotheca gracillima]|nr:MAG: Structural maintenance of chromosomes protein 5 [Chaenotheca gracillima]
MPALDLASVGPEDHVARHLESTAWITETKLEQSAALSKRILIPINSTSSPGLIEASTQDPWSQAGKYALGWVYFCIILLVFTVALRLYHLWTDKIRTALYKEEVEISTKTSSPDSDYEMINLDTNNTVAKLFPRNGQAQQKPKSQSSVSSFGPFNNGIALFRSIVYRPIPDLKWKKRSFSFPSLGVIFVMTCALIFVTLYCFLPQPFYYRSIRFGSPPLAIRAGMLAVAMMPWIIAMSMKANLVSMMTGIGPERLNVLHRYGGYLCLFLSLVHTVPFYVQPVWDRGGKAVFSTYFNTGLAVYATGIASLVPLIWLCVASLPIIRKKMYELFVALHVPVAILYLAMLFWHCNNYLTSWNYLWATLAIWVSSYIIRLFKLNWTNPRRLAWLVGDEAAITLMTEDAIKVTIPTQKKWRPGQYVYLRMPGISVFGNHPFTIASLCSDDFPSEYGEEYRDMMLVFKPFGGFTKKVKETAIRKGPFATYRAFIDGPYGGMERRLEAFDNVVLIAGGSGITAIVSQLLELVKRMRDGKAVTKTVHVVWAIKRLESMEWFREELRICREFAPPDAVHCQFHVTAAKRHSTSDQPRPTRPVSGIFGEKLNDFAQGIASKRSSAYIRDEAGGDIEKEQELRRENEDAISALPAAHRAPAKPTHKRQRPSLELSIPPAHQAPTFDFGFPSTPTMVQKNIMRFAFGVSGVKKKEGWSTEYGRPDIPYILKELSEDFGRRTCVFVCGPPTMRTDVANTIASLQSEVWSNPNKDELFLHTENYAI